MESIKKIVQSLAGEDITEENLDRLSLLTNQLSAALQDQRTKVLLKDAQVAVVLPKGFEENKEQTSPVIAVANEETAAAKSNNLFSVPRPPSVIKVHADETQVPPVHQPIPDNKQLTEEVAAGNTDEEFAMPEEPAIADKITAESDYNNSAHEPSFAETIEEVPLPTSATVDLDLEVEPEGSLHFELAINGEFAEEEEQDQLIASFGELPDENLAVPHNQEEKEEEEEKVEPKKPADHLAYLPESMRIRDVQAISALRTPIQAVAEKTTTTDKPITAPKELNDALHTRQRELSEVLKAPKINDLRKGISINDKYQYVQNLFRADEQLFERSIKTLNSFKILPEAQYWMQRELVIKLGWNDEDELVQQFYALISRRFC